MWMFCQGLLSDLVEGLWRAEASLLGVCEGTFLFPALHEVFLDPELLNLQTPSPLKP